MASEDDERWREALRRYEARRERIRRLRAELAQARAAGLAARHARRMKVTQERREGRA